MEVLFPWHVPVMSNRRLPSSRFSRSSGNRDGPTSVRDVLERVNQDAEPPRAYTSVMSLLNVMTDKGLLRRSPHGRAFLYEPVSPREHTLRSLLGETLKRVYDGSASLLVAHLLDQSHPSIAELDQIRTLLNDYKTDDRRLRRKEAFDAGHRDRIAPKPEWPADWFRSHALPVDQPVRSLGGCSRVSVAAKPDAPVASPHPGDRALARRGGPDLRHGAERALASRRLETASTTAVISIDGRAGKSDESPRPDVRQNDNIGVLTSRARSSRFRSILSAGLTESIYAVHWLQPYLLVAWGAGVLTSVFALAVGTIAVQRMCREGQATEERIRQRVQQMALRAGFKTPPRVIVHPQACEPFLCGFMTPVIVLPEAWLAGCKRDLLDAILAHELAHALRRDHLVNLAQRLVEIALFFSPAVHWLSRSLRRQRESCAMHSRSD